MIVVEAGWWVMHESPVPARIAAGGGSAVHVSGWLFHADAPTVGVWLAWGDEPEVAVDAHSMGRPEVSNGLADESEAVRRRAQSSGFWGVLPVPAVETPTEVPLKLRMQAANGASLERVIGYSTVTPYTANPLPGTGSALVVCLATFEPEPELFAGQIESIRTQAYADWHCLVVDDASSAAGIATIERVLDGDPRFTLVRHDDNRGFYGNFERALALVPVDARYVALADQDDVWFPHKLDRLVERLDAGATLAYGDMHIVDRDGTVRQASYWSGRRNNHTRLAALLSGNTVTGAAAAFERSLLDVALPFPPGWRRSYHDHWLALVALTVGRLGFVDEPLQAYVQHGQQVLGAGLGPKSPHSRWSRLPGTAPWLRRLTLAVRMGGPDYFGHTLFRRWLALVLLARTAEVASAAKRRTLERAVEGDHGTKGLLRASGRAVLGLGPRRSVVGAHGAELRGALWRRWNRRAAARAAPGDPAVETVAGHVDGLVRYPVERPS